MILPVLHFGDAAPTSFVWASGEAPKIKTDPNPGAWSSSEIANVITASAQGIAAIGAGIVPMIGRRATVAPQQIYMPPPPPAPNNTIAIVVAGFGVVALLGVVLLLTGGKAKPTSPFAT